MSNHHRARLPRIPGIPTTNSSPNRNFDVQNNSISSTTSYSADQLALNPEGIHNNNNDSYVNVNILGSELCYGSNEVIGNLSDQERSIVLGVLNRDQILRQNDAARYIGLKKELNIIKKRNQNYSSKNPNEYRFNAFNILNESRTCARCQATLGKFLNRGAFCLICKLKICKNCRKLTYRTNWICIVCQRKMQSDARISSEFSNKVENTSGRRGSTASQSFIPKFENLQKTLSRSWTISHTEDEQNIASMNIAESQLHSSINVVEANSHPNLQFSKSPCSDNIMDSSQMIDRISSSSPRRGGVVRQSTMPNPDATYQSSMLKLPVSPKQQLSPQYSPNRNLESIDCNYSSDQHLNETRMMSQRLQVRRQSTLPCYPIDFQQPRYPVSPNRAYNPSPDALEADNNPPTYYPYARQSIYSSNSNSCEQVHQRHLPTSPNVMNYNKSPDSISENEQISPRKNFVRQSTLPNPDKHIKLLPTSPPCKSPQFAKKRSPEFQRQMTISNPEGMSTLSIPQFSPKFLPISPKQKQSFLFSTNTATAPRTFLSQQNFPPLNDDQPPSSPYPPNRDHQNARMIKVRSHSNEEYSIKKNLPNSQQQHEGRRLLPEIPTRTRSPNRLVRQDRVSKEEYDRRFRLQSTVSEGINDEDDQQYENLYGSSKAEINNFSIEIPRVDIMDENDVEVTHNCSSYDYHQPSQPQQQQQQQVVDDSSNVYEDVNNVRKTKPDSTIRSASEDMPINKARILPRRSFSHPEKETLKKSQELNSNNSQHSCQYKLPKTNEIKESSLDTYDASSDNKLDFESLQMKDVPHDHDEHELTNDSREKTAVREIDIQSAVEQAASLFKKVVIQKRKEKQESEIGLTFADSDSDSRLSYDVRHADDYKLTFSSPDTSETEDENKMNSQIKSDDASTLNEFFWDYYETTNVHSQQPSQQKIKVDENVQFIAVPVPILMPIDNVNCDKFADLFLDPDYMWKILNHQYTIDCDVVERQQRDHLQQQQYAQQRTENSSEWQREESDNEKKIACISTAASKLSYVSDSKVERSEINEIFPPPSEFNNNFNNNFKEMQSDVRDNEEKCLDNFSEIEETKSCDVEVNSSSNSNSNNNETAIQQAIEVVETKKIKNNTSISIESVSNCTNFEKLLTMEHNELSNCNEINDEGSIHDNQVAAEKTEQNYFVSSHNNDTDNDQMVQIDTQNDSCANKINLIVNENDHQTWNNNKHRIKIDDKESSSLIQDENSLSDTISNEKIELRDESIEKCTYAHKNVNMNNDSSVFSMSVCNENNITIIHDEETGKNIYNHTSNTIYSDQTLPANNNTEVNSTMKQEMFIDGTCSGVVSNQQSCDSDGNAKFKSLVMISSNLSAIDDAEEGLNNSVQIISSKTTHIVRENSDVVSVQLASKNWQPRNFNLQETRKASNNVKSIIDFYEERQEKLHATADVVNVNLNFENANETKQITSQNVNDSDEREEEGSSNSILSVDDDDEIAPIDSIDIIENINNNINENNTEIIEETTVEDNHEVSSSAVVCLEDGLADDDSWVEDVSQHDSEEIMMESGSEYDSSEELIVQSSADREEELRGYNRVSIDFTLHTIVEESCEESEQESLEPQRVSASELEKYFFFGLGGDGATTLPLSYNKSPRHYDEQEESQSETSSICSEGLNSSNEHEKFDETESTLTSSRLEKYFLSGFMGFSAADDTNNTSNDSGSVGSDSEGKHSPEQRRKKLVRARGSSRSSQSSSLDNLLSKDETNESQNLEQQQQQNQVGDDSSETDTNSENVEKNESHSDTIKRKKKTRKLDFVEDTKRSFEGELMLNSSHPDDERKLLLHKTESTTSSSTSTNNNTSSTSSFLNSLIHSRKQHSRDSGFVGSNDDLLKNDTQKLIDVRKDLEEIHEETTRENDLANIETKSVSSGLSRKDSFNAWSSDEETNLMMSKMRQIFKTLVAASANTRKTSSSSKTNNDNEEDTAGDQNTRFRSPQLVYFENELTRLMKTVPGIKDEHVREIVEYFSSEDTWSDSYDSSDYTSSDKETVMKQSKKIQQQISASCQEIIEKFDSGKVVTPDEEGDMGDGGLIVDDGLNKETAFVYQKLMASISKIQNEKRTSSQESSPPFITKVMHHIGSRLVALMHEVSSNDSTPINKPKSDVENINEKVVVDDNNERSVMNLGRSKSHDLLLSETKINPEIVLNEERETSDNERFSWRGSFESALLADSSQKLCSFENSSSSALSVLIAKRRSVGDLLFSSNSLSSEQLDRVRSCGSIDGERKDWKTSQNEGSEKTNEFTKTEDNFRSRSTLPRILQLSMNNKSTNSLPRLPTSSSSNNQIGFGAIQKAQSVYNFLHNNVKSARYRPPGFRQQQTQTPKRISSIKLQNINNRSEYRKTTDVKDYDIRGENEDSNVECEEIEDSTMLSNNQTKSQVSTPTGLPSQSDESDIDRLVALHQKRNNSLSSLGLRSDSMASVYSGAGEGRYGTVQVKGSVEFGLQYNYKQGALEIHIKQCKDLAAVDMKRMRSDPYVKVYLLPDKTKSGKRKTKVKKHSLNPVFDEVLRFYMSLSSLESRTLWLTVWHSDMFGRNDFLGEVMISLQNKIFDNPLPQWYQLEERSEPFEDVATYRGDIIVGLKFIPQEGAGTSNSHGAILRKLSLRSSFLNNSNNPSSISSNSSNNTTKGSLHVMVKEAKHLSPVKANGHVDSFCKSYLLPEKTRSTKQKTHVVKRSKNPGWNHTFIYEDLTLSDLAERALELTIWDHDRLASNEFLGGVRFSLGTGKHYGQPAEWNDASGKELTLWQSMLNRPNFWVEGCLSLRSTFENRTYP